MKQTSFASLEYAGKKRVTRREKFLGEMQRVVPWPRLLGLIEPHYPKSGRVGRPPIGLGEIGRNWGQIKEIGVRSIFSLTDGC